MSGIIKTIKAKDDNNVEQNIFPKTVLEAVVDSETNETLDVILDNLNEKIDNIEPGGGGGGEIPTDVQEQLDGKVSKSGDTMTGDLTVKANVNIPLLADNSDTTMATVPTAGTVDIGSTEQKITDVLTSYKSFMGSIHTKDAWNNIISTRHRNGASDGVSHGMYLRSLMNRSTPDLMWAVQAAGTWQSERAILDSGNYSAYTVPKTGGTFTGDVTFEKNIVSTTGHNFFYNGLMNTRLTSNGGKTGFWKFLTITAKSSCTYAGAIISFKVTHRGNERGIVNVMITNAATAGSGFSMSVSQEANVCQCYFIQSATGVFDMYLTKSHGYDAVTITDLVFPEYQRERFTLTWSNTHVDSLPNGTTKATAYTVLDTTNYSSNIPSATQSAVGLMSAADKKKLDGIATGANKITVESSLSNTSTNPVQSKVVHSHMAARLQLTGGTMTGDIKFSNAKGIKDVNGRFMLVRDTSTTTNLGSIVGKYPTFIGNKDSSSDATYIRGQYIAIDATTVVNSNKSIGVTSDKRVKTNESLLVDEIEKYNQFFDNLQPRKYNYTRDEEGTAKTTGFFAQEVHQALLDAGLTLSDFGGINIQESFLEGQANGNDEAVWYQDFYSLAYDEFIPIIVSKIQYLEKMYNARLEEIENDYNSRLQSLEEKISKLEEAKV